MKYCVNDEEMRRADAAGDPAVLMERAGQAIAAEAEAHGSDFLVVCGSGNNGGDGYVAARYLAERGKDVAVFAPVPPKSAACKAAAARFRGDVLGRFPKRRYQIVVDCLFGTGLSRPLEGIFAETVRWINGMGAFVVSADLPSGISGTSGQRLGEAVRADVTLALACPKQGCFLGDGIDFCGKLVCAGIGLPVAGGRCIYEEADVARLFPPRPRNVHKGTFGKATIVGGSRAYTGAPLLSLGALLKMGVGYAELVSEEALLPHYIGVYPEALLSPWSEGILSARAIALGMGCGVSETLYGRIRFLLERYRGTLILDADGLNSLALYGTEILTQKACTVILTPHPGEFARLSGIEGAEKDPVGYAEGFAERYGVVLLLKGAVSVVTDGKRTALNLTGTPALAKGGSGDVLSGIVCGLAARLPAFESAAVGAYLLGRAGEEAAKRLGAYSATATDVIASIPALLRQWTEQANEQGKQ